MSTRTTTGAAPAPQDAEIEDPRLAREWLVTNGLGGYASGSVLGPPTRRYHGPLVAALPAPLGRIVLLEDLTEEVELPDGTILELGGLDHVDGLRPPDAPFEFVLESGVPVWRFRVGDATIEKRVVMSHQQNTAHVLFRLVGGSVPIVLRLRPWPAFRGHGQAADREARGPLALGIADGRLEIAGPPGSPPLRLAVSGGPAAFEAAPAEDDGLRLRREEERGQPDRFRRLSPGMFRVELRPDATAAFTASTEPWETALALGPEDALDAELDRRARLIELAGPSFHDSPLADLVLAADAFLILPASRAAEAVGGHAVGEETRSVIAGYPWFTDWGRDTMIGLEGLTLATGRHREAADILVTFAHHVRDGLIPNLFPEGEEEGLYHTADASLWFVHAVDRYRAITGDDATFLLLLPTAIDIVEHHLRGTRFGIGMDPADALLRQGAPGYQLTWMDAKVDGWVVTPRRGKAVEINALWYNALRLVESWRREAGEPDEADRLVAVADRAYRQFNARFWNEAEGCLYDVVDGEHGDDPACRPNQVFAISPRYPVLDPSRWEPVLDAVRRRLLTPVGLRSLAPGHTDYRPMYFGDLRSRDAAYHQGTVWPWLLGAYADAWRRCHPDDAETPRRLADGLVAHLGEAGVGSLSEIFDAEPPYKPRGCVAQAWSVAELIRMLSRSREGG